MADIKWDSYFHVTIHLWLYAVKTKRYVYHNHVTSVKIRARYYVSKDTNQMTNTSTSKILDLQQGHIHLQTSTSSSFSSKNLQIFPKIIRFLRRTKPNRGIGIKQVSSHSRATRCVWKMAVEMPLNPLKDLKDIGEENRVRLFSICIHERCRFSRSCAPVRLEINRVPNALEKIRSWLANGVCANNACIDQSAQCWVRLWIAK